MNKLAETPAWLLRGSRFLAMSMGMCFLFLLLPWDQFAPGEGQVVGRNPNDRFQEVHAPVSGFVRQWHVNEGSWVEKGQPLVSLSDTDADLIDRLEIDLQANQDALTSAKLALQTAIINRDRQKQLFEQGLSARKDWEEQKIKVAKLEMEVSKAQSEQIKAEREIARQRTQQVIAPRSGRVVRVISGEGANIVHKGDTLLILAPTTNDLAVEFWVSGDDVALIRDGARARLEFSGWPAVQTPGWPAIAIGTFRAKVALVDAIASSKGKFRVLLVPDETWPSQLFVRQGARVSGFIHLSSVTVGQELWRQFNGLPAAGAPIEDELNNILYKKTKKPKAEKEEK